MSYLQVLHVWEGDSDGHHCPGILITEIQPLTDLPSAHSYQESSICNSTAVITQIIPGRS